MTANNPFAKKDEVYGFQTLYRELGYYISRLEHYEKSLKFFDEAIKKTPNDKRALIGRSRARAKACQYEGAIADINKALSFDPDDLVVLADKALNTYLSCEFEEGLVQNTRLLPIRQKPDNFTMGVMHCSNAIENCIGERAGRPLRDHFRIIRKLAWKKNYEAQKPFEPKPKIKKVKKRIERLDVSKKILEPIQPLSRKSISRKSDRTGEEDAQSINDSLHDHQSEKNVVPPFMQPFPFRPLQNYTTNIENYMAEKYLDSMYLDKIFLMKLQTEPGAVCPNKKGSAKIKQLAKNGYKTVSYKQELLRTRRPFYYIKYQEATSSGALKSRQQEELVIQQQTIKKEADVLLGKLNDTFANKKFMLMMDIVEKLKYYCDSKPKRLLPNKDMYLKEIYDKIRRGYFELNRINLNQDPNDQNKRILNALGLPLSREPSSDSVIEQFKNVFVDYKKRIATFEKRLKSAENSEEICWYYHELCKDNIGMKKWELARVYGRKCIQEARNNKDLEWVINGYMQLARINVQQHNKNDAKNDIGLALEIATQLQDPGLCLYLRRCLKVIETIEFDDIYGPHVLEKREKKILSMMSAPKMKDEFAHIFRMMAAMPASRRMSVMPGVRIEDVVKKSQSKSSRKQSIMPHEMNLLRSSFGIKQQNKKSSKGVGFLELIQYHV